MSLPCRKCASSRIFQEKWRFGLLISNAAAAQAGLHIPSAERLSHVYRQLNIPVAIIAGSEDRLIKSEQPAELHRQIAASTLRCILHHGHMIHQTATAEIMRAIDSVADQVGGQRLGKAAY